MAKLVLLLGIVALALWLIRPRRVSRPRKATAPAKAAAVEDMVRCAQCGLHLPVTDAVSDGETHFCGEAHRLAYAEARSHPSPH